MLWWGAEEGTLIVDLVHVEDILGLLLDLANIQRSEHNYHLKSDMKLFLSLILAFTFLCKCV